jgi:putative ATP-binding cassette transporter
VCIRLGEFVEGMDRVDAMRPRLERGLSPGVRAAGVSLALPDGAALIDGLELSIASGERVLVSGRSGCGKTTLLRAIAGIWPLSGGTLARPSGLFFLPQKPYLPVDTLRAAIAYPLGPEAVGDAAVREALAAAGLEALAPRLDEHAHWSHCLSGGEQQRVAFARAFLHRPEWLFLDEATSALDEPAQAALYAELLRRLPGSSIVSVAHRASLGEFHQRHFDLGSPVL